MPETGQLRDRGLVASERRSKRKVLRVMGRVRKQWLRLLLRKQTVVGTRICLKAIGNGLILGQVHLVQPTNGQRFSGAGHIWWERTGRALHQQRTGHWRRVQVGGMRTRKWMREASQRPSSHVAPITTPFLFKPPCWHGRQHP